VSSITSASEKYFCHRHLRPVATRMFLKVLLTSSSLSQRMIDASLC